MTTAPTPAPGFLNLPVPIVFTVCQAVQQIADGTFNVLSVYDRLNMYQLPDGRLPDTLTVQVLSVWTGGVGVFTQVLRLLDADGHEIGKLSTPFTLTSSSQRHYVVSLLTIPAREGIYTLTMERPDLELLRQDFTIGTVPFPGTAQ